METREAASVTSRSRMRAETSHPSSSTRFPPILGSSSMRDSSASLSRAASSSKEVSDLIAFRASARYMAPLSRLTYPSLRARREAIVLLPAPAGPSMAMMSLRGTESVIGRRELYTAKRRRAYHRGREGRGIEFFKLSPCSAVCSVCSVLMVALLADVLRPGPRDEGLFRRRD